MLARQRRGLEVAWTSAAGLVLGACSGGGDAPAPPPTTLAFASAAVSADEDAGALLLDVVLTTTLGSTGQDASVTVSDEGTGSASSGSDYAAFAPVVVTFPAGSTDGAVQQVTLTLLDDLTIEGPSETVRLRLSGASGAALASPKHATVTLLDGEQATLQFASGASATIGEASASYDVTVELSYPAGVTLGADVSVRISDTGAGTATSGADYASFATETLDFPALTPSASSVTRTIDVLDDGLVEGDESVRIGLSLPSSGATVGSLSTHQLTITDDDASGIGFLYASEGPSGVENPLTYNALVDLGTEIVKAGPNPGTLVRIANIGGSALGLGAPRLTGQHPNDFAVEIESAPLPPPTDPSADGFVLAPDLESPLSPARASLGGPAALELDPRALAQLELLPRATLHGFPLPGQGERTLELRRLPPPFAPGAVLAVDGVRVPGGPRALLGDLSLWSGTVLEIEGSRVFLALSSAGAQGFVELPGSGDRLLHLFPASEPIPAGAPPVSRWLSEWELAALVPVERPPLCAAALEVPGSSGLPSAPPTAGASGPESLTAADCAVAVETDWQLYQKFGSVPGVTNYVTQMFAAISDRYLTDVQTTLSIAYLGIYSSAGDPWTSQDSGGDASALLSEFRSAWNASGWPAPADLAHFVSGASLGGGVAYVNVLCNQSFGYGVSGNISGAINWGSWTGQPGALTWDFVVVAHELGHNFGANHTHSYCPPLDKCYTNCQSGTVCSQGTLMSYCHTCPGGMNNIDLYFHPVVANVMRTAVNSSCLGLSVLAGGDYVQYLVRFNPLTASGTRNANLDFPHDAANQPTPFRVRLTGDAQ